MNFRIVVLIPLFSAALWADAVNGELLPRLPNSGMYMLGLGILSKVTVLFNVLFLTVVFSRRIVLFRNWYSNLIIALLLMPNVLWLLLSISTLRYYYVDLFIGNELARFMSNLSVVSLTSLLLLANYFRSKEEDSDK
ncbi:hypothetical protein [Roseibium salinum]|uniref:Uncharacterized protein n=1 Tax=Roseibium salinum TaxID=1604349 RepID=A0ABT3QXY4_9HYPH|nr:hypothetical protein [Roseibium sp. DSM 29163]MCX2721813.1 hypothetical protein [Roseibium sp. DSM 29163]